MKIRTGDHIDTQPAFISSPEYTYEYGCVKGENNQTAAALSCKFRGELFTQSGATHVLNLGYPSSSAGSHVEAVQLVRPNSISILWQLPQFFVITLGEVVIAFLETTLY
jgi:hypothetical protein